MSQADDKKVEQAIQATGQQGRRVRMEQIDALMATVTVHVQRIEGTCSTIALAMLPIGGRQFSLAIGHSACVDPAMFNAEIGTDIATKDALAQARKKLWEFEGYALMNVLAAEQLLGHVPGTIADEL